MAVISHASELALVTELSPRAKEKRERASVLAEALERERWTVVAHLSNRAGRQLSIWSEFSRTFEGPGRRLCKRAVRWAVSDASDGYYRCGIDVEAPESIDAGRSTHPAPNPTMARAVSELLRSNRVALPERQRPSHWWSERGDIELSYGGNLFATQQKGTYRLVLGGLGGERGSELTFRSPQAPEPWSEGTDSGSVECGALAPHCSVRGWMCWQGEEFRVSGVGNVSHRRIAAPRALSIRALATRRAIVYLDDGTSVSIFSAFEPISGKIVTTEVRVGSALGPTSTYLAVLEPLTTWRSTRSYHDYHTEYALRLPAAELDLTLTASFPEQEILSVVSSPPSWSGRMQVNGTRAGRATRGVGWLEESAFVRHEDADEFFAAVRRSVRDAISDLMVRQPSTAQLVDLIGGAGQEQRLDGVDPATISAALIEPLLTVIERGGKAWRSFAALACIDAVGGDSQKFMPWLAMPELIHVGSLIVDDVEDRSLVRRGGPSCHRLFGEPLAINAGSAAYFLAELALRRCPLPPERAARINRLYFDAMRAGHAGQALDITDLHALGRTAVATGDVTELERRVRAINRLKTAVPAGTPARMGAIAGGGNADQVEILGRHFETVALAFQIVDDVLNLRGFKNDTKQRGEDIRLGKVTLPLVKALGRLDPTNRKDLWRILTARSAEQASVERAITLITTCGALDACMHEATALVDQAWADLDPVLPDSYAKLRIRAFGYYVLERLL